MTFAHYCGRCNHYMRVLARHDDAIVYECTNKACGMTSRTPVEKLTITIRITDHPRATPRYRVTAPGYPAYDTTPEVLAAFKFKGDAVKFAADLSDVFRQSGHDVELEGAA